MAEAALGGGIDIGDAHLGALIDLKASFDGLSSQLAKILAIQDAYQYGAKAQPIRASGISPASGSFTIKLGGPAVGRRWEVRRLIVGGATYGTAVNGTAQLVASSVDPMTNTPALWDVLDNAVTLPNPSFYSTAQIVVRNPQRLYLTILTPSATTLYSVGGEVLDVPDITDFQVVGV